MLAEPAVTPFAILGGTNHIQPIQEMPWQNIVRRSLSSFPMGMLLHGVFSSRLHEGYVEQVRCAGIAPENDLIEGDLIEGDVGACLSNPF